MSSFLPSRPHFALLLTAALTGVMAPSADPLGSDGITVRGQVLDRAGAPVRGAWVHLEGARRIGTAVDAQGRYALTVAAPPLSRIGSRPLRLSVRASRDDWRITLPGGEAELVLEMELVSDGSEVSSLEVRSNVPSAAAALAEAMVLEPGAGAVLDVGFLGAPGFPNRDEVPVLSSVQRILLYGDPGPEPASPEEPSPRGAEAAGAPKPDGDAAETRALETGSDDEPAPRPPDPGPRMLDRRLDRPPAPGARTRQAEGSEARRPALRGQRAARSETSTPVGPEAGNVEAPPAPSPPVPRPARATGACRIDGTVEVRSDLPLAERLRVVVYLDRYREVTDTVELFMGSPRAFRLDSIPCGPHRLRFETPPDKRFQLVSPEPIVHCSQGAVPHVRLVLESTGRGRLW